MLGIRCFRECAIDIWVGELHDFEADMKLSVLSLEDLQQAKLAANHHVAMAWTQISTVDGMMLALLEKLKLISTSLLPRRITLILTDKQLYLEMRDALEKTFEDLAQ